MYPSGFDYMAPPPPYPGPPQNWTAPPQNWTAAAAAPPGMFLSLLLFPSLYLASVHVCVTAPVRSDLSASKWITSKHTTKKKGCLCLIGYTSKLQRINSLFSSSPYLFLSPCGFWWKQSHGVSLVHCAEMSIWHCSILGRAWVRCLLCVLRVWQ